MADLVEEAWALEDGLSKALFGAGRGVPLQHRARTFPAVPAI